MGIASRDGITQGMSLDLRSLDRLKSASGNQPRGAIRDAAKQLETLFMQELLKSMRATTMNSGLLENEGTDLGNSMLDSQLAGQMAGIPGGLSEQIVRQLERQLGQAVKNVPAPGSLAAGMGPGGLSYAAAADGTPASTHRTPAGGPEAKNSADRSSTSEQFIRKHQAAAEAAASASGIPATNILGQAALESGWGKHEIRMRDGSNSHNLFGIKATADWKGRVAEVTTTEYIGGVARKVTAKFKAYESYADAFKDHARLLTSKPRYVQQLANASDARSFASGLQRAGYATDPSYADKLTRVINTALRLQKTLT